MFSKELKELSSRIDVLSNAIWLNNVVLDARIDRIEKCVTGKVKDTNNQEAITKKYKSGEHCDFKIAQPFESQQYCVGKKFYHTGKWTKINPGDWFVLEPGFSDVSEIGFCIRDVEAYGWILEYRYE